MAIPTAIPTVSNVFGMVVLTSIWLTEPLCQSAGQAVTPTAGLRIAQVALTRKGAARRIGGLDDSEGEVPWPAGDSDSACVR